VIKSEFSHICEGDKGRSELELKRPPDKKGTLMSADTILAISSEVLAGEVGLNVIRPTLRSLSLSCIACPTLLLASHPGAYPSATAPAGQAVAPEQISQMVDWLIDAGALSGIGGVLTGYMPSPEHVMLAANIIDRLRDVAPNSLYLCDPICGDRGRLYIGAETAQAIRTHLLPRADITTPNLFELGWLTDSAPSTPEETIEAARHLPCKEVVVTSAPAPADHIATLQITEERAAECQTALEPEHIHGMGDVFAALYLGLRLRQDPNPLGVATATAAQLAQSARAGRITSAPIILAPAAPVRSL